MAKKIRAILKRPYKLSGSIQSMNKISGKILVPTKLTAKIQAFSIKSDIPEYEDSYTIKPAAFQAQELNTKNKRMTENLTVLEIPYYNVSNNTGNTIFIGSEVRVNGN